MGIVLRSACVEVAGIGAFHCHRERQSRALSANFVTDVTAHCYRDLYVR